MKLYFLFLQLSFLHTNYPISSFLYLSLTFLQISSWNPTFADEIFYELPISSENQCPYSSTRWLLHGNWKYSHRMMMLGIGSFMMGTEPSHAITADKENLRKATIVNPFWIDRTEVTISEFSKFVHETNYETVAEVLGTSYVFWLEETSEGGNNVDWIEMKKKGGAWWWSERKNVNWKSEHRNFESEGVLKGDHPVVHVSWDDAAAFCRWRGGRLPTETEWEYSCSGNSRDIFPWGNQLYSVNKTHMTNIWQGQFPQRNTKKDGFLLTAPVRSFLPNQFGICDLIGNVWEWVDGPWESVLNQKAVNLNSALRLNPNVRVQKGGSFLCHRNHCFRYRCGARTKATRDSTASNVGFRCAANY